jgi:chaperonin GroES
MKIQPLGDRVVVKPFEGEEITPGGIVIPDAAREKSLRGEVVAVGPGRLSKKGQRVAPAVKKGDHVVYDRYAGDKVEIAGVEYLVLREEEILGCL